MRDKGTGRGAWLGGGIACSAGLSVVVLLLLLLQAPMSVAKPASVGEPAFDRPAQAGHRASVTEWSLRQVDAEGWQTVFSETFESGVGSNWTVTNTSKLDGGQAGWVTSTFMSTSGDWSAWCGTVGGGGLYTDSMDTWLVSDPIDLGELGDHVWDAEVRFDLWLDASYGVGAQAAGLGTQSIQRVSSLPRSGDWFGWGVLTDVTDLESGRWAYVSGKTAGWARGSLPLDAFLPLTDAPAGSVRIAFRFVSDDDGEVGRGAFVDDVVLQVDYGYKVALPLVVREPPMTPTLSSRLQNASFEEGWCDVAIGQEPNQWDWHWVDGETLPGSDDPARAPETRVLPREQLPPYERDLFILDGTYCVKVFKSYAPIYAALSQDLSGLKVGRRYRLSAPVYLDVFNWEGGKAAPDDPSAARVRLGAGPTGATWRDEEAISYGPWWDGDSVADFYLAYNDYDLEFTATDAEMTVYVEVFAKWGLENNGFFMDDFKLFLLP